MIFDGKDFNMNIVLSISYYIEVADEGGQGALGLGNSNFNLFSEITYGYAPELF